MYAKLPMTLNYHVWKRVHLIISQSFMSFKIQFILPYKQLKIIFVVANYKHFEVTASFTDRHLLNPPNN